MAGTLGPIVGSTLRKSGWTVWGRLQGQAGTDITQASLTSIAYSVYRIEASFDETLTGSGTLSVGGTVFDAPVSGDPRTTAAYNFLASIPASCFQTGDRLHRVEVLFTPVTGQPFTQEWSSVPR